MYKGYKEKLEQRYVFEALQTWQIIRHCCINKLETETKFSDLLPQWVAESLEEKRKQQQEENRETDSVSIEELARRRFDTI